MRTVIIILSVILITSTSNDISEFKGMVASYLGVSSNALEYFLWLVIVLIALTALPKVNRYYSNVSEGTVGVVTRYNKFVRALEPGFNIIYPWESIHVLSVQTRAIELEFQAITLDQASVYFNCTILFSVVGTDKEMVRKAVYAFASPEEFVLAVQRLLEDETRAYVATKRQAEMIGISQEVVIKIKENVDTIIAKWGYQVEDLRYNNLHFDDVVTQSMARVVAAVNEREAAENEGHALLIRKTKAAEADGEFVRIQAEAERTALKLRGQGISDFRKEVAKGVHIAVDEMTSAGLDPNFLLFFMYTETLKHIAEHSKAGSTIFVDSNPSSPNTIMRQMSAFYSGEKSDSGPDDSNTQ